MPSIFRTITATFVGFVGSLPLASGALAQPAELAIAADKDWQHDWTPMTFPARIGGFERQSVSQYEERQTNVAANYWDGQTKTNITFYIYRPGNPDSAIWFDRALIPIGARDVFGNVDLDDIKVGSFVPNGGTAASGQFAVLELDGQFRSTAVSLYRAGEWLVKLRISSQELSVTRMAELLQSMHERLPELADVSKTPAYFIEPCEAVLSTDEGTLIEEDRGFTAVLGISLGASIAGQLQEELSESDGSPLALPAPIFCREGERAANFNIYRPDQMTDRYFLGVGDSGFGVTVAPDPLQDILENEGNTRDPIIVSSSSGLETSIHAAFDGTPNVQQTIDALNSGTIIGSANRPLGDETQTINIVTNSTEDEALD